MLQPNNAKLKIIYLFSSKHCNDTVFCKCFLLSRHQAVFLWLKVDDAAVLLQALQKRLIQKTEEVVEKELLIQEKEKLYMELKHILARQPGPEVAEQLRIYQETLRGKTKQMKVGKDLVWWPFN